MPEQPAAAPLSVQQTAFESALVRADRVSDPDEREAARANIFATWAETDPHSAFLHLKAHGFGEADHYRCGLLFRQWADRDFAAAFDCAERQSSVKWREEMLGWLALVVAQSNPAEAAAIADRDMKPGPVRTETSISILHQWARTNLARAAAWADSFPQGAFRDRALDEVAGFMGDVPPASSPN